MPLRDFQKLGLTNNTVPTIEKNGRIGIFDSGVGGLTVLRELYQQLPNESILYFGDTARLPYGTRTPAQILQFVREILTWMVSQGVKMIVMACNTSDALALDIVRCEFDIPTIGLILPASCAAVGCGKRIGVIATPATAASNAYRRAILEADPTVQVWQIGCPEFVPLIEQNLIDRPYLYKVARDYLAPLQQQQIDTLVYGCTHYPLITPVIRRILPETVQLVNPAVHVALAAARELELLGLKSDGPAIATRFTVSGCPENFACSSVQWLGYTPLVEKVYLSEADLPTNFVKSVD